SRAAVTALAVQQAAVRSNMSRGAEIFSRSPRSERRLPKVDVGRDPRSMHPKLTARIDPSRTYYNIDYGVTGVATPDANTSIFSATTKNNGEPSTWSEYGPLIRDRSCHRDHTSPITQASRMMPISSRPHSPHF
ncbi:unnamed protein product, partial [Prunus brigantina]